MYLIQYYYIVTVNYSNIIYHLLQGSKAMETITVQTNVYTFSELSDDAKEKVLNDMRETNVFEDWYLFVYEDFKEICKTLSLTIDLKQTYFSGFGCQSDGCSSTGYIDIVKFYNAIHSESWKNHAPNLKKDNNFSPCLQKVDKRVLSLIEDGILDTSCYIKPTNRESSIKIEFECENIANRQTNIAKEIESLEYFLDQNLNELNSLLFNLLEREYEYQTSDNAIIETIQANEYKFTEDGEIF